MLWLLSACVEPPQSTQLDVTGLEGASLLADGLWVRETLTRDGVVVESLHSFLLGGADLRCEAVRSATGASAQAITDAPVTDRASCEAARAAWRVQATHPWNQLGLNVEIALWGTGDGGSGIAPSAGTVQPIGPDGNLVEYTLQAHRVQQNWPLQASLHLDCDAAEAGGDPWADVPVQEVPASFTASGPLTFQEPAADHVDIDFDVALVGNGAQGGTIQGMARLHACDTTRALNTTSPGH